MALYLKPIHSLTDIAEHDGEEDKSMESSPEQHKHVHTEIVDLKNLRLGKE